MRDCPEFLEIEDEMGLGTNSVVARISRDTAEAVLGRTLADRTDFLAFIEAHRDRILHAALIGRLSQPFYDAEEGQVPGGDRVIDVSPEALKPV